MSRYYSVGVPSNLIVGIVGCIFSLGCSIGAFAVRQFVPALIFVLFLVMSLYVLLGTGKYEISDTYIENKNAFGHFRIPWEDVRQVEYGNRGSIVLHGENKRLVVVPPSFWSGPGKVAASALMRSKLERPDISSYQSSTAQYKVHKNVRV